MVIYTRSKTTSAAVFDASPILNNTSAKNTFDSRVYATIGAGFNIGHDYANPADHKNSPPVYDIGNTNTNSISYEKPSLSASVLYDQARENNQDGYLMTGDDIDDPELTLYDNAINETDFFPSAPTLNFNYGVDREI